MTPEERAQSVLHFLDAYLSACINTDNRGLAADYHKKIVARQFLGMALVALVTEAKKDE